MASSRTNDTEATGGTIMDVNNDNEEKQPEELFPGCTSINDFSQKMLRTVVQATKTSNDLPTGDDYDYYSTYDTVRNVMDLEARRLLTLLQNVMRHHNVKGTISGTSHALELDEQFDVIMDANDQILERVGTLVDEATGVRKNEQKLVITAVNRPNPAVASWNQKRPNTGSSVPVQLLTAKNIQRPQLSFRDKVDNSNKPFVPCIRHKPHAKKTLHESLQQPIGMSLEDTENPDFAYPHPYQFELDEWQPSQQQLEQVTPQEPKPVDSTPPEFIDTVSDLAELCDLLTKEKEFAVDLEHHSYRTFQGFTCLMQISTRTKDFLVDTLALRSDMAMLNEVFTDPNIIKVFHGADSDIQWLQRDFGIYVVNMFDTGQAARVLSCARFSLAHLLHSYCQVEADKQFQLSDWRMRPLHENMVRYAQEDTHYLLYVYDRMRNELIERGNEQRNLLRSVYERSKLVCLKVYNKVLLTPDSHEDLYLKTKKVFNSQQLAALKDIYSWRDRTAREEDESVQYVLPNHMLLQIAEILPRERQGVLACCNPIPPQVRQCQHELHSIILQARETPLTQREERRTVVMEPSLLQHPQYHTSITACPHDLSKHSAEHGHLNVPATVGVWYAGAIPVKKSRSLLGGEARLRLKNRPILSALDPLSNRIHKKKHKVAVKIQNSFHNPFVRFLPKTEDSQQDSVLKPKADAKVWRLKQHTASVPHKRKSDVDLNTFAPEFAPPVKKKHSHAETPRPTPTTTATTTVAAAATSSPAQPSSASTTTTTMSATPSASSQTPVGSTPAAATEVKKKKKEKKVKIADEEEEEEEQPLSSRQMMKKKKKEKKAARKEAAAAAALTPPTTLIPPLFSTPAQGEGETTPQSVVSPAPDEKKKKKKKTKGNVSFASELVTMAASVEGKEGAGEEEEKEEKKKKKKKGNAAASLTAQPELGTAATSVGGGGEEEEEEKKKKKKKKKKQKGGVEEEGEVEVIPFDYASADKSTVTGKVKKKVPADVYNPHFKGDKRKKKGKKERFGAKQKKSASFKADGGGGMEKL